MKLRQKKIDRSDKAERLDRRVEFSEERFNSPGVIHPTPDVSGEAPWTVSTEPRTEVKVK